MVVWCLQGVGSGSGLSGETLGRMAVRGGARAFLFGELLWDFCMFFPWFELVDEGRMVRGGGFWVSSGFLVCWFNSCWGWKP